MWSKLFGGGDRIPCERVDAVVRVIDRYLSEEVELHRFQTEKQTIHPRDLPSDKRRALIEEVFAILGETGKRWARRLHGCCEARRLARRRRGRKE
jgi:hypothetical protein